MDVFDIRDPLPTGTLMLEASAGTGKTWTIGALVTRFVAEGAATLDELLVVTFSRAATQELRDRVRTQLLSAERALADPDAADRSDALIDLLLDADAEEIARRQRRVRHALSSFDAATIATIHQFCQLVLRGLGVAGDTDSEATLVENLDDLVVEVVDDTYLRGFGRAGGTPAFDRTTALRIARDAIGDPQATLLPEPDPASVPGRRAGFAGVVRREVERRKRRHGVLSFDDLLARVASALEPADSPARQRLRRRWKVVLVDEFQDTDPVQWEVFDRAFSGHSTLVLIGDPKQAVYGFRGGDVVTYLQAQHTATDRRTLARNWRADAPLVRAQQAVLRGVALGDPEIVVHDVEAQHEGSRLAGLPGGREAPWRVRAVPLGAVGQPDRSTMVVGQSRPYIARDVAADIAVLLASGAVFDGRPLDAGDIAVLARTGAQLRLVHDALAAIGIPSVLASTESVLGTPAGRDWLSVLEAMAAPHRSGLVRAAALSPLIGSALTDLDEDADTATDQAASLLRRWAELYALRGIPAVLEAATTGGLPERVLSHVGGERLLTDLRHVAEVLHQTALEKGMGLAALTAWLRRQVAGEDPGAVTPRSRRLDSDAHAVQLATIHKSKGLQFPVVYLPFVADEFVSTVPDPARFHGGEDGTQRCLDIGGDPAPVHVERAKAEDDGERLRLFYVALTRAQSQVVTYWAPTTNANHAPLHRLLLGRTPGQAELPTSVRVPTDERVRERLQAWADAGGPVWEDADHQPDVTVVGHTTPPTLEVRRWTRDVDQEWKRTSYTALSAVQDEGPGVSSEPEQPVKDDEPDVPEAGEAPGTLPLPGLDVPSPMADLPVGATFGSLVHAVLEEADPQAADLKAELRAHVREQASLWPVQDLDQDALTEALVQVCLSPLGPLTGEARLVDIGRRDRLCEMDFELPLAGGDLGRGGHAGRAGEPPGASRGETASPHHTVVLGDIAPLLRRHLSGGDPLLAYADALDAPELGGQPLRGYLTGSVDVVLRVGERYLVVDYKTNWLGPPDESLTAAAYAPAQLAGAMGHSSYPLQALLYAVVLHRFLRWRLATYDPATHLGGVLYLYLRGMCGEHTPRVDGHPTGVFSWQPPVALVEALSDLLDGRLPEGGAA